MLQIYLSVGLDVICDYKVAILSDSEDMLRIELCMDEEAEGNSEH